MKPFEFDIYKKLKKLIENEKPKKILFNLNVSGGKDSMSLLHAFYQISNDKKNKIKEKYTYIVQHFDHKTRHGESKKDALFVEEYCKSKGIPFFLNEFSSKETKNFQSAARLWRKKESKTLLLKLLKDSACETFYTVTAHHLRDKVESIFLNILRGTGMDGLRGMKACDTSQRFFRPLLDTSYEDLLSYTKEFSIPFREDSSNKESYYARNYLRHNIFPLLPKINKAYEKNILNLSQIVDSQFKKEDEHDNKEDYALIINKETQEDDVYRFIKRKTHLNFDLNSNQVKNILHEAKLLIHSKTKTKKILTLKSGHTIELYSTLKKVFLLVI